MSTQNDYDRLVESCCREALNLPEPHDGFITYIVNDILNKRSGLAVSRNHIGMHVKICLGCIKYDKLFIATENRPLDVVYGEPNQADDSDIEELLRMIRGS